MSTTALYTPEPGSAAARVLDIFAKAPDEYFTSGDLGNKLNVPSNSMRAYLKSALEYGLLKHSRELGDDTPYWRVGPRFADWLKAQAAQPANPTPRQPSARTKRGGMRALLPPLDVSKLVIQTGVPKPERRRFNRAGDSKYAPLFDALQPGQSVEVPAQYMATLYTHTKKLKKAGLGNYTVQRTGVDTCTLWRDA